MPLNANATLARPLCLLYLLTLEDKVKRDLEKLIYVPGAGGRVLFSEEQSSRTCLCPSILNKQLEMGGDD